MRGRPKAELVLSEVEREQLKALTMRRKTAQALALRARIVLASAEGLDNKTVAAKQHVTQQTVSKWRARFVAHRLDGLLDAPRPGAPRSIDDAQVDAVIAKTLESVPANATHWSTRSMARAANLSASTVTRIWRAFGLSLIDRRPSSSPPTHCSWRRCAISWGCTSTHRSKPWCCALTRRARFKHWTARNPCYRWRQASPSDARTTTCAMARQRCSPRWTSPLEKLSVNCIAAVSSCSFYARLKPTCHPSSMCISSWTTTAHTRRRRSRLGSLAIRASTFISHRPPPHGSIKWNAGLQPSRNNTSAAAHIDQPDNLSKPSINTST